MPRRSYYLPTEIVADLHLLLIFVRCLIDDVIAFRSKKKCPICRLVIDTSHPFSAAAAGSLNICNNETYSADQVEKLISPAVMVVTVNVPSLHLQEFKKPLIGILFCGLCRSVMYHRNRLRWEAWRIVSERSGRGRYRAPFDQLQCGAILPPSEDSVPREIQFASRGASHWQH
jgi:hypothetical protein